MQQQTIQSQWTGHSHHQHHHQTHNPHASSPSSSLHLSNSTSPRSMAKPTAFMHRANSEQITALSDQLQFSSVSGSPGSIYAPVLPPINSQSDQLQSQKHHQHNQQQKQPLSHQHHQQLEDRPIPLPHEDFEPYFTQYAEYDSLLNQTITSSTSIKDLAIPLGTSGEQKRQHNHQQQQHQSLHQQQQQLISPSLGTSETSNLSTSLPPDASPTPISKYSVMSQQHLLSAFSPVPQNPQAQQQNQQSQIPQHLQQDHHRQQQQQQQVYQPYSSNSLPSPNNLFKPAQIARYSQVLYGQPASDPYSFDPLSSTPPSLGAHPSAGVYNSPSSSPTKQYLATLPKYPSSPLKRKSMSNLRDQHYSDSEEEEDDDDDDENYSDSSSPSPKSYSSFRDYPPPTAATTITNINKKPSIAWQPIITAPKNSMSEEIIKMQQHAGKMSSRKSCLPPGKVDSYMAGPNGEGMFECLYPNCGKLFRRRYNVRSHIQTHLCDRPYGCDVCGACFVRPHDLRRHEKCHKDERPYVCPCGKGFSRHDALQRHRMRQICSGGIETPGKSKKSPGKRGRPRKIQSMVQLRSQSNSDDAISGTAGQSPFSDTGFDYIKNETDDGLWSR